MTRLQQTKYSWAILLLISVVWTFLLYFRVISFDFVNWDDNAYVFENNDIIELSIHSISRFFSSFYLGMYQPLTMLSFAVEYHFFGLNPSVFHATNLIFHLLNVSLVFFFIFKLSGNRFSAFIVSLFFGIHPLHVESVAWISERKDVLYTLFYLAGLISYLHYLRVKQSRFWILTLIFFILSLLSKSAAVTFPLVLLLLHFYKQKDNFVLTKSILKIWPFFILSVLFGLISLYSQKSFYTPDISQYNYHQLNRLFIAGFTYFTYIFHLIYPAIFSVIHPLPFIKGFLLPSIYYFYFALSIIILSLTLYFYKRGTRNQFYYDSLFGFFFYTLTIFLILYNPASKAVYADRYTYLPYIGLFFILTAFVHYLIDRYINLRIYIKSGAILLVLLLGLMYSINAHSFINNWKNALNLWNTTILNEPSATVYFNRAIVKKSLSDVNGAINDYSTSLRYNDHFYQAYFNIASLLIEKREYNKAIEYLNKARNLKVDFPPVYYNLALVYFKMHDFNTANKNIKTALNLEPDYPEALILKATIAIELVDYPEAIINLNKVLSIYPSNAEAFYNKGLVYGKLNQVAESIKEYTLAIKSKSDYGLAYYSRANAYASLNKFNEALNDVNHCLKFNPDDFMALTLRGYLLYKSGYSNEALTDLNKAIQIDSGYLLAYNNRALVYRSIHDNIKALRDLNYLLSKDPLFAPALFTRAEIFIDQNDLNNACKDLHLAYKLGIAKAGLLIENNCR